MKILHTSDWHLGHTLYNYDRTEEQTHMLQQIEEIVRQQQPDVFILAGDVYHTSQPSAAVQTLFANTLVNIHEACKDMTIVITAGNHDSGSRHEIFRTPWQALNVYAIGNISRDNTYSHIIEIPGKGFIIAIPYCNERNIPDGFFSQLLDDVAQRNTQQLPVVMTAHTTVNGCDFTGHDHATDYTVGGIDSIDISQLGEGYDYLALGHIHHEQFVHTGHHNVRYSGTPLAVSFDENYPHSVSMVEICHHGDKPRVTPIEITNLHPLVTLPATGAVAWNEALDKLKAFPDDIPAYIRLNVIIENFLPVDANAAALAAVKDKKCRFCYINAQRPDRQHSQGKSLTIQEFQQEDPVSIARRYAADKGITFTDEMNNLFREVLDMLNEDSRND